MLARWGTFAVGLGLVAAPLVVGYGAPGPILHHVALGLLVCVTTLVALEWPPARFLALGPAIWMAWSARSGQEPRAAAVELVAAVALAALALVPAPRLAPRPSPPLPGSADRARAGARA